MTDLVKVEIDAGVMTLTLARPEKKNALSNAMYGALADGLEDAAEVGVGAGQRGLHQR